MGELQKVGANEKADSSQKKKAASLEDDITEASKTACALKEMCRILRSETAELSKEVAKGSGLQEQLQICGPKLVAEPNILMEMVHSTAKKLTEVRVHVCETLLVVTVRILNPNLLDLLLSSKQLQVQIQPILTVTVTVGLQIQSYSRSHKFICITYPYGIHEHQNHNS